MKLLIRIAMILFCFIIINNNKTEAQINLVETQGSGYYIQTAEGDTLQLSGQTPFYNSWHTALRDAAEWSDSRGGEQFFIRRSQEFRGSFQSYIDDSIIEIIEVVDTVYADTVFVPTGVDTVYADTLRYPVYSVAQPDQNILFKNISWNIDQTIHSVTSDTTYGIDFVIETEEAELDTLYTEIRCGNEWVENNMFVQPAGKLLYGILWDCSSSLTYQMKAISNDGWEETIINTYPRWMSYYGEIPATSFYHEFINNETFAQNWQVIWGAIDYSFQGSQLILDNVTRNISRLAWMTPESFRNVRVEVTETIHASHSTGIHMALRTSAENRQHSVETYFNLNGIGVSIFSNGSWSNPINFPFEWEYGQPYTYIVELVEDTIRVKAWNATTETEPAEWLGTYSSDVIGGIPNGYFSMGSTGAGLYIVDSVEVTILDE